MVAINPSPKVRPTNGQTAGNLSRRCGSMVLDCPAKAPSRCSRGGQGLKICGVFDDRNRGPVWPRRCRLLKLGGPELTQDYDEGRNGRLAGQEKAAGVDLAHVPGFGAQQFGSLLSSGRTAWDCLAPCLTGWLGGLMFLATTTWYGPRHALRQPAPCVFLARACRLRGSCRAWGQDSADRHRPLPRIPPDPHPWFRGLMAAASKAQRPAA
jgi:hypothetical protein